LSNQNYLENELLLLCQGFPKSAHRRSENPYIMKRDRFSSPLEDEKKKNLRPLADGQLDIWQTPQVGTHIFQATENS